jgi:hypothetical protein
MNMIQVRKKVWLMALLILLGGLFWLMSVTMQALAANPEPGSVSAIFQLFLPNVVDSNAATGTVTPVPPGYLANPGFEQGLVGWTFNWNTANPIITSSKSHTGGKSGSLGDDDLANGNGRRASIVQSVTVPADQPFLVLWTYFESSDECGDDPDSQVGDYLVVSINNVKEKFWPVCDPANGPWVKQSVDLNAYKGQLVWLKVEYISDLTIPSAAYVDDFGWSSTP